MQESEENIDVSNTLKAIDDLEESLENMEELKTQFNLLLEIAEEMYSNLPCDSEFSTNCTPCRFGDFLNKLDKEKLGL